jgi:hypothetical protein
VFLKLVYGYFYLAFLKRVSQWLIVWLWNWNDFFLIKTNVDAHERRFETCLVKLESFNTVRFMDLDLGSKRIIDHSMLTTFEASFMGHDFETVNFIQYVQSWYDFHNQVIRLLTYQGLFEGFLALRGTFYAKCKI